MSIEKEGISTFGNFYRLFMFGSEIMICEIGRSLDLKFKNYEELLL